MSEEIQFEDLKLSIRALWRKKLLIITLSIFTGLMGVLLTYEKTPQNIYDARTSVYSVAYASSKESDAMTSALDSYSDIITSNKVSERAATLLKDDVTIDSSQIPNMITVNSINDSIIEIVASSPDPQTSISVSNAVAEAFVREITSVTGNDDIQILDAADTCGLSQDGSKELLLERFLFLAAGGFLGAFYIIATELMSSKIGSVRQCIEEDENEILGLLPFVD